MIYRFIKEDFDGDFLSTSDCAGARAIKRVAGTNVVSMGVFSVNIDRIKHRVTNIVLNGQIICDSGFEHIHYELIQQSFIDNPDTVATMEVVKWV